MWLLWLHFADDMSGPSHDLELFRLFLKEHDVPQQLALLCLDAEEVNIIFFSYSSNLQNLSMVQQTLFDIRALLL